MKIEVVELKKSASLDAMKFLAQAMSRDTTRAILNLIHVEAPQVPTKGEPEEALKEEFIAVATDGRRLHAAKIKGQMEPGDYRIIKANQSYMILAQDTEGATYPNWNHVVPKFDPKDMKRIDLITAKTDMGLRAFKLAYELHELNNGHFNLDYIMQATREMFSCYVHQVDNLSPLVIQDKAENWERLAVVMPTRDN